MFDGYLREPLLYAVLDGRQPGRVWVDDPDNPSAALVWSHTECVYAAGGEGDLRWQESLRRLVLDEVIPAVKSSQRDFISIFSFPDGYADKLAALFQDQVCQRTPMQTFSFDRVAFEGCQGSIGALHDGLVLAEIDGQILRAPENEGLAQEVAHYWGSVDAFLAESYGYCVLDDRWAVSYCYSEAYGGRTRAMTALTLPGYRELGLATVACAAFVDRCLDEGDDPFWMCDDGNVASRRLSERLGFVYRGDISLVDIPFHPFDFYRALAEAFFLPNRKYGRAAEAYEKAFGVQEGGANDYYSAAQAWAYAGNAEMALRYLQEAFDRGWLDVDLLETAEAFHSLRRMPQWKELLGRCFSGN
jgi:tetratricopeptide (TPR) repeat protein